jgi:hypothetical protein
MILRLIVLLIISALFYSCSSMKVTYDYDKNIDFSKYKTYAFTAETKKLPVGDLNRDRVIKAVENEMNDRGYSISKSPDLAVDLHVKAEEKVQASAMVTGSHYGPYRYPAGSGFSSTNVSYNEYTDGTLFISIVDMEKDQLIWTGTGTKTIDPDMSPEQREKAINSSIKQIMANYPPPN